jgi:hypothetical protein
MGPINGAGQDFISELGHRISDLAEDYARETSFLFQRISVALQRFNAVCFTNSFFFLQCLRQPTEAHLDIFHTFALSSEPLTIEYQGQ